MRATSGTLMLTGLLLQSQSSPNGAFVPPMPQTRTARLNRLVAHAQPTEPDGHARFPTTPPTDMQNAMGTKEKLNHIQDRHQARDTLANFLEVLTAQNKKMPLPPLVALENDIDEALTALSNPELSDTAFDKMLSDISQHKQAVIREVNTKLAAVLAERDAQWPENATVAKADHDAHPVNVTQVNAQIKDIVSLAQHKISNHTDSLTDLSISVTDFQAKPGHTRLELQLALAAAGRFKSFQSRISYETTPNLLFGAHHHLDSDIHADTGEGETVLPVIQEALRDTVLAGIPSDSEDVSAVETIRKLPRDRINLEDLDFDDYDLDPDVRLSLAKIVDKLAAATDFKSVVSAIKPDVQDVSRYANRFVDNKLNSLYTDEDNKNIFINGLNVLVKMIRRTMTGLDIQAQDGTDLFHKTPSVTATAWGNLVIAGGKEQLSLTRSGFDNKLSLSTRNGLVNFILDKLSAEKMENTDELEHVPTYVLATLKYVERLSPRQKADLAQDLAEILLSASEINDEGLGGRS